MKKVSQELLLPKELLRNPQIYLAVRTRDS